MKAKIGDIKFSSVFEQDNQWLLCDGSKTTNQELINILPKDLSYHSFVFSAQVNSNSGAVAKIIKGDDNTNYLLQCGDGNYLFYNLTTRSGQVFRVSGIYFNDVIYNYKTKKFIGLKINSTSNLIFYESTDGINFTQASSWTSDYTMSWATGKPIYLHFDGTYYRVITKTSSNYYYRITSFDTAYTKISHYQWNNGADEKLVYGVTEDFFYVTNYGTSSSKTIIISPQGTSTYNKITPTFASKGCFVKIQGQYYLVPVDSSYFCKLDSSYSSLSTIISDTIDYATLDVKNNQLFLLSTSNVLYKIPINETINTSSYSTETLSELPNWAAFKPSCAYNNDFIRCHTVQSNPCTLSISDSSLTSLPLISLDKIFAYIKSI